MAETETLKGNPQAIAPGWGWIELLQVLSLLLIPVGAWLLRANEPWLAGAALSLAIAFFIRPFYLVKAEIEEAEKKEQARIEAEKAKAEAEKTAASLVEAKKPEQGMTVTPYHSSHEDAEVYHIFVDCNVGTDIEPENWTQGDGDKTLCKVCEGMTRRERAE